MTDIDGLDQLIREEVLVELRRMSERGARQDQRLERLERWTLMPTDYDPLHPPVGRTRPRDIKLIVREAIDEKIDETFSWVNFIKIAAGIGIVVGVLSQITDRVF